MLSSLICTGWLLTMDVSTPTVNSDLYTTTICVKTEDQCRRVAGERESTLRQEYNMDKKYPHYKLVSTCTDLREK